MDDNFFSKIAMYENFLFCEEDVTYNQVWPGKKREGISAVEREAFERGGRFSEKVQMRGSFWRKGLNFHGNFKTENACIA